MKKILFSILLVASFFLINGAYAADDPQLKDYKYLIVNEAGEKLFTAIPTSVIDPAKHRILAFSVTAIVQGGGYGTNTESYAALYDATSLGNATNKVAEGEIESNDASTKSQKYERALNLLNGVVIGQGAWTATLVEWEYKY